MNASFITQRTDKSYYENTVNMQSLEGLQYATELRMIYTTPDFNASENWGITSIGKLSDLEALRSLTKFKAIDAEMDSIYDISPLSDKSLVNNITEVINGVQLIYSTQLQQNHIIDASPLKLSIPTSESNTYQFGNQIYIAPEITINPNTTSNYMQSKYIKGVDGANVPVKYYPVASTDPDSWMNNRGLGIDYKSTADEDSATTTTTKVAWTNLKKNYDSTNNLGYMTVMWNKTLPNQTSYSYQGWYIQPYRLDDNYHDKTTITVHYQDKNGNQIKPDDEQSGALHDSYSAPSHDNIKFNNHEYRWIKTEGTIPSQFTDSNQEFTYVYGQLAKPVTVHYVDAATQQTIAPDKTFPLKTDKNYPGIVDDPYDVSKDYKININGYTYKDVKAGSDPVTGTLGETGKTVTYEYTKNSNPTPPNPGPGPKPEPTPQPTPTPTPTVTMQPSTPGIAKKGEAVYALKKIYMYSNKDFKKSERIASYAKKPRINRPMFVVTDYAKSKAGNLRYVVRDVNHHSKTAGKKGYITADYAYVRPVYYHSSHKTLTVINPSGVNEYKNKNLSGKVKNFKQGTQLKVKGFVKHNLTTRYLLSNGHYITGNRKLVIAGSQKQPKQIKVKKAIYRYNNANFGKRTKHIKNGTVLKVKKWEYSHPYSATTFGAKRYAVAGGYVTANSKYVKVIK